MKFKQIIINAIESNTNTTYNKIKAKKRDAKEN